MMGGRGFRVKKLKIQTFVFQFLGLVLHHMYICNNNAAAAAHPVVDLVRVAVGVVVDAAAVVLELGASRVDTHTDRALGTNIYNAVSR